MSKEVATTKQNEIVNTAAFDDFADFAGEGFGETNSSDFVIPRLGLVGDLSPQKKRGDAKYIEGSETGDIIDSALNIVVAKGYGFGNEAETVPFLPVKRIKEVITWKPRNAGGGIVHREVLTTTIEEYAKKVGATQNDRFEWKLPNGDEVIETWQLYGLDLIRNMPVFVPFKKTNLKAVKPWFTQRFGTKFPVGTKAAGKTVPLLFRVVNLHSFEDSGNGNKWANWKMVDGKSLPELENGAELKTLAEDFLAILNDGAFTADLNEDTPVDEDIPF